MGDAAYTRQPSQSMHLTNVITFCIWLSQTLHHVHLEEIDAACRDQITQDQLNFCNSVASYYAALQPVQRLQDPQGKSQFRFTMVAFYPPVLL
jgi:hypothetical protein